MAAEDDVEEEAEPSTSAVRKISSKSNSNLSNSRGEGERDLGGIGSGSFGLPAAAALGSEAGLAAAVTPPSSLSCCAAAAGGPTVSGDGSPPEEAPLRPLLGGERSPGICGAGRRCR